MLGQLRSEEGSASVTAAGIIAAVTALAIAVAAVVAGVANAHRARVAADLAAVAAATALYQGVDACSTANDTAQANGGSVETCEVDESDVQVSVRVGRAVQKARAGPV